MVKGGEKIKKKTRPDKQLLPPFLIDGYSPDIKDFRSRYLKTKKLLAGNHFSMSIANRHFTLWVFFIFFCFYLPNIADETTLEVSWKRVGYILLDLNAALTFIDPQRNTLFGSTQMVKVPD